MNILKEIETIQNLINDRCAMVLKHINDTANIIIKQIKKQDDKLNQILEKLEKLEKE